MATPQNEMSGSTAPEDLIPGMPDEPEVDVSEEVAGLDLSGEPAETIEETTEEPAKVDESRLKEEVEARAHNWVDKDEWVAQGKDPKFWNDAAAFNDFNRKSAAVMSRENRELRQRLEKIERDNRIKEEAEREARENLARESLNLEFKQAKEDNDWDRAFEIQNKLLDLKLSTAVKPQVKTPENPEAAKAFHAFIDSHPAVKVEGSPIQRKWAQQVKLIIDSNGPGDPAGVMAEAWENVQTFWPKLFAKPNGAPMADTGGTQSRPSTGRDWSNLKPQVRAEYDKFLRDNPGMKKDNLLKRFPAEYFRN